MRKKRIWGVIFSLLILFVVLSYPKSCSKKNPPPLISPIRSFAIPCRDLQKGLKFYTDFFSFKFRKNFSLKLPNSQTTSAIELALQDKKLILFQSFKKPSFQQLELESSNLTVFSQPIQSFTQKGKTIRTVFIQDPSGNVIQCKKGKKNAFIGMTLLVSNLEDIIEFYDETLGFQNFYRSSCEGCFHNKKTTYESLTLSTPKSLQINFFKTSKKIRKHSAFFISNCKRFHTLKGLFQLEGYDSSDIYMSDKNLYFWVWDPNHIPLLILKSS